MGYIARYTLRVSIFFTCLWAHSNRKFRSGFDLFYVFECAMFGCPPVCLFPLGQLLLCKSFFLEFVGYQVQLFMLIPAVFLAQT